jgi:hypothetical protein
MFELCSKRVPELGSEIAGWDEGHRVSLGVLPSGPYITLRKRGGQIEYLGPGLYRPRLAILFKNLDTALMMFSGQLGAAEGTAEQRVVVQGDLAHVMQAQRAMAIVQSYLFPAFMMKNAVKRPVKMRPAQLATKAYIMSMLIPKVLATALRPPLTWVASGD